MGKPETVNDFLAGDPGSNAGRRLPAMQAPADELPETDDAVPVTLPASVVLALVKGCDLLAEHSKAIVDSTSKIVGLDTLELLVDAGVIHADTLETTEDFEAAVAIAARALAGDAFAADVEAAERLIDQAQLLPAAGSFSAG